MFIQKITLKMNINNITDYEIKLHDVNDNEKIKVCVNEKKEVIIYKKIDLWHNNRLSLIMKKGCTLNDEMYTLNFTTNEVGKYRGEIEVELREIEVDGEVEFGVFIDGIYSNY